MDRIVAAVALGSNLGARRVHLDYAVLRLRTLLQDLRVSRYYETAPVDVPGLQPCFLNAVAVGAATGSARQLLDQLFAVEQERGRERHGRHGPRTLDLDLVLFGDSVIMEEGLVVPHPRFRERRFVLAPLAEIAPELIDPVTGQKVSQLLTRIAG